MLDSLKGKRTIIFAIITGALVMTEQLGLVTAEENKAILDMITTLTATLTAIFMRLGLMTPAKP